MYKNIPEQLRPKQTFAGQLDPAFLYADKMTRENMWVEGERQRADFALSASEKHRLVETPKSPTRTFGPDDELPSSLEDRVWRESEADISRRLHRYHLSESIEIPCKTVTHELQRETVKTTAKVNPNTKTVAEFREFCDEYRIRIEAAGGNVAPPVQEGERESSVLSNRGARNIADSAYFMALKKGGYKTFVTGTMDESARKRVLVPKVVRFFPRGTKGLNYCPLYFEDGNRYTPVTIAYESKVQKEVTRAMDAINKMYQRGWRYEAYKPVGQASTLDGQLYTEIELTVIEVEPTAKVTGIKPEKYSLLAGVCLDRKSKLYASGPCTPVRIKRESLPYCWVVEIPDKEKLIKDGDVGGVLEFLENGLITEGPYTPTKIITVPNPHVHFMMDWRCKKKHFRHWAKRLEGLWDNGYFHIEKIKVPMAAGAYLAKAAGYMNKGAEGDQGVVIGNRYGISASARAPKWEKIGEGQLHIMGQILADLHDHNEKRNEHAKFLRDQFNEEKDELVDEARAWREKNNKKKNPPHLEKRIEKVYEKLIEVRGLIEADPVRAGKYQAVFKGKAAFMKFMSWAKEANCGSNGETWLPVKPEGEAYREGEKNHARSSLYFKALQRKFHEVKQRRHAATNRVCEMIVDQINEFRDWAFSGWGEYETLDLCQ